MIISRLVIIACYLVIRLAAEIVELFEIHFFSLSNRYWIFRVCAQKKWAIAKRIIQDESNDGKQEWIDVFVYTKGMISSANKNPWITIQQNNKTIHSKFNCQWLQMQCILMLQPANILEILISLLPLSAPDPSHSTLALKLRTDAK